MISSLFKYFVKICLIVLFAFNLISCSNQSGKIQDDPKKILQSYDEKCDFCHGAGRVADVSTLTVTPASAPTTAQHKLTSTKNVATKITGVTISADGKVTIAFTIFDSANPLIPLSVASSAIRFTIVQLDPAAKNWQSYINRITTRTATSQGTTPIGTTAIQATSETANATGGVFTDNKNGTYTYQLSFDVRKVTTPKVVIYNPSIAHRVAMQVTGNVANAYFDFVPDGSKVTSFRKISTVSSCNECHIALEPHGSRVNIEYCVTCHNIGSTNANTGNSLDIGIMAHKIHRGKNLPEVKAGGRYMICGNTTYDFSDIVFPQDIRNCIKCHTTNSITPDGDNWKNVPSQSSCTVCHAAKNVSNFPLLTAQQIVNAHTIVEQAAAAKFQFNILSIMNTAPGQYPIVNFSVTDPTNANTPYNIFTNPAFIAAGISSLSIIIGWNTNEYTNTDSLSAQAQPIVINPLSNATPYSDGSFTVTSNIPIPLNIKGSGIAAMDGHPATKSNPNDPSGKYDLRVPVKTAVKYFPITDISGIARREIVDVANCNKCHGALSRHGSSRNNEIRVCSICHNANATDINYRPPAGPTIDGKTEEAIHLKYLIHSIHSASYRETGIVIYGSGGIPNDFTAVKTPAGNSNIINCTSCHKSGTYMVPITADALPTTIKTDADLYDPDDDTNITPTASACSSCHYKIAAKTHMAGNGGNFTFKLYKIQGQATTASGGPSGTQPPGHSSRTDCVSCHG